MNLSDKELERRLRDAPRPRPPVDLRSRLQADVTLPVSRHDEERSFHESGFTAWLRHWWPALAPAAVSVACAAVITYQQIEINQLREAIRGLKEQPAAPVVVPETEVAPGRTNPVEPKETYQEEIDRLRAEAGKLRVEIATLESTRAENERLRQELAMPIASGLPQEILEAQEAMEKARSIQCVNNLKQFGLAVRIWAMDNDDAFPPDSLSMSNELNTPKILLCPSDVSREAAPDWASFTRANQTYDYLASDGSELDPQRVLSRCRIHGNIGLSDGSVQMLGTNYMQRLAQRDGKLYLE
jgi:hypothetical protein